jgi:hypothetical protein
LDPDGQTRRVGLPERRAARTARKWSELGVILNRG